MTPPDCFRLDRYVEPAQLMQACVECDGRTLSYAELIALVDARAQELSPLVRDGDVVAIRREKSERYVVDLLAVLARGAVAMPVDPSLPDARVETMMDTVAPQAVITDDSVRATGRPSAIAGHSNHGNRPAYVMFTSGSTGKPKAILGSVSALLHFVRWQGAEFGVSAGDRVSFLTPVGFDVSLRDIFLPLLHGGVLVIPSDQHIATPGATAHWLARERITVVHAVPSVARLWTRAMGDAVPALRLCFLAGEKLYPATVAELRAAFGETTEYVNLYGPSETTLAKFFFRVGPGHAGELAPIPVGRPLPGTSFGLGAAESGREVVITTRHATLGYINAPEAETKRFVRHSDGTVSYRTGDLGEVSAAGDLVIVGRADDEVKVNGVRVHPNEVTQALQGYSGAQDVCVFATTPRGGSEPRLAAVWIAGPAGQGLPDHAPREHALRHLPQAIVPTIWRKVAAFPRNANGKVDRARLADLLTPSEDGPTAAASDTEAWLCRAVGAVLACDAPCATADLFGLGATSIHVAFLIGKVEEELGKSLAFADVFALTRLRDVASLIDRSPARANVAIPDLPKAEIYALSPQQRRWWNIYMPDGNRSWATMVRVLKFDHTVDARQLERGLLDLARHQDSMRLSFVLRDAQVLLKETPVTDTTSLDIEVQDFSGQPAETAARMLDALRLRVANAEIPTDAWPLFRACVAKLPGGGSAVVFAMHHMIGDGFSMNLVETQLRHFLEEERAIPVPSRFNYLAYADWAAREEALRFGPGSEAQAYWARVFSTPYRKHVFAEKWTGPGHDRGQGYGVKVPDATRAAVKAYARAHSVTEFSLYLSAKFRALHRLLDQPDLVIGTPAAGRELKGTEELVGNFISLVCVRSRRDDGQSALHHVRRTMQGLACAMTHQGYQYDKLVADLGWPFEQSRFPLTTVFISYLNFSGAGRSPLDPRELGFSDLGFAVKFDKMSYVREHDGATSLLVQYRNNLFDRADIEAFASAWIDELDALVCTERTDRGAAVVAAEM
ncbi:AMP-binding protein [uncultured Hydrogenophaga sp.]|uniref:amino acid adenylation domain-containing protein n=1 Tax=uncultured Hydrogenophaga sp. TaxID=199683 RepID=UPI00258BA30E|nr:AMP-binding protein [uncultured Hydrogenophaga sp.]